MEMSEVAIKIGFTGVALGPGDPELITVKGLKALQNADVIYYAASKIDKNGIQSFSKNILDSYQLNAPCRPLHFPMTGKNRAVFYQQAYEKLKRDAQEGLKVVMVTEGDLGFYSTFGYIMKLAKKDEIAVNAIPGVPAFIAGGAQSGFPIVEGDRHFTTLALPKTFEDIKSRLNEKQALVVMKMKVLNGWFEFLSSVEREFIYVEKTGTVDEFITSDVADLKDRSIPYFALIIFPGVE